MDTPTPPDLSCLSSAPFTTQDTVAIRLTRQEIEEAAKEAARDGANGVVYLYVPLHWLSEQPVVTLPFTIAKSHVALHNASLT